MSEEYNGYTNWETWNVSLWLSNDQGLYQNTIDILCEEYDYQFKRLEALEEFVCECLEDNIIKDNISIHRVNWQEVAEGFSEESDKVMKEASKIE